MEPTAAAAMASVGAFHAGVRLLLPLRRSPHGPSPSPWSHFRSHLISSKPTPNAPLPPPLPTAHPGPSFGPPSRKTGAVGATGAGVVGWYLGLLDARPVLTKSVTAAAIFTAADLTSQVGIFFCPLHSHA
jgi:protein Mpv17